MKEEVEGTVLLHSRFPALEGFHHWLCKWLVVRPGRNHRGSNRPRLILDIVRLRR